MKSNLPPFDPQSVPCARVGSLVKLRQAAQGKSELVQQYLSQLQVYQDELIQRQVQIKVEYPDLPIAQKLDDLRQLLTSNQVVIVEGETGSGKTTQIPKLCLELGFAHRGLIACTQPRRIAALSIADRLREELKDKTLVGSRIRFHENCPPEMKLVVMTDGVLLQEYRQDPWLSRYSCLILDEAHERSLNMDLLLGIFKLLQDRRPDLKIIITSATLDAQLFSQFFAQAPIVKVEGRSFPVEIHYEASLDDADLDEKCAAAILTLMDHKPDHLLCFLPTERDILETATLLEDMGDRYEILPLYARLPQSEQAKVFGSSSKIKIILATNVAETSLTIPGIAYVVDSGLARVSRYQPQNRIQGLPVEKISQASTRQRSGRAGRVKSGICVRLYSQEDMESRAEYTDPEILRSSLDNVVLHLRQLGLDPEAFPFVQCPNLNALRQASRHLWEIGALEKAESNAQLTSIGRRMVQLPMDAILARMLIEAVDHQMALPVAIVAAALSLAEIRLNPPDPREKSAADMAHKAFAGGSSDYLIWIRMWNAMWNHLGEKASRNRLRAFCKKNYMAFQRSSEWIDLTEQFLRQLKVEIPKRDIDLEKFNQDLFHQCLLSGLVAGLAQRDPQSNNYRLSSGKEAFLVPSSGLFRKKPEWILAANIRETQRIYLATAAEILPHWVEHHFARLCKKHYRNPTYNAKTGFVEVIEEVRFRNFLIAKGRQISYDKVDPQGSSDLFFRDGVAPGILPKPQEWVKHNRGVLERVREMEKRLRIQSLGPENEELGTLLQSRLPLIPHFRALELWIKNNSDAPLRLKMEELVGLARADKWMAWGVGQGDFEEVLRQLFPAQIALGKEWVDVEVLWDPGQILDGLVIRQDPRQWAQWSPNQLAALLPAWRKWIWDKVVNANSRETAQWLNDQIQKILPQWQQALEQNRAENPLLCLWVVLRPEIGPLELRMQFPKSWESFECLHFTEISGSISADLGPEMSHWQWLQRVSQIHFRQELRGKVVLLDYDRIVLQGAGYWMAPAQGVDSLELILGDEPCEPSWGLHQLRMQLSLRQRYPRLVQMALPWIQNLARITLAHGAAKNPLEDAFHWTVLGAFALCLDDEDRQLFSQIPNGWKEAFGSAPVVQSKSQVKAKGLDSLSQLRSNSGDPAKILSASLAYYSLSFGMESAELWQEWMSWTRGQSGWWQKWIQGILTQCPSIDLPPGVIWSLVRQKLRGGDDPLPVWIQSQERAAGRKKNLKKMREEARQRLLPYEGLQVEKQQIQSQINDLESKQDGDDFIWRLAKIQELLVQTEMSALKKGIGVGNRQILQTPAPAQVLLVEKSSAPLSLAQLKAKFGKI